MNQHFLYNILNHIQYFINKGEKEASLAYISRLSRLLRQWMESAEDHRITADAETTMLQDYLSLEAIRFPGRFTFEVNSELKDAKEVLLVPHIIFPLAEQGVQWIIRQPPGESHLAITIAAEGPFIKGSILARSAAVYPQQFEAGVHIVPHHSKQHRSCNELSL